MSISSFESLADRAAALVGIGGWQCDLPSERLTWTDGVYDLFGLERGSAVRRHHIVELYDEASRYEMERLRARAIRTGEGFSLEAAIRNRRGERRWMRLTTRTVVREGRVVQLFGAKQDITDERAAWARLRLLAHHDALTGLPNRHVFDMHYLDLVEQRGSFAGAQGLALVDLDNFKMINDRFGHAGGDECLRQVAKRLLSAFGPGSLVARLGGDEFAVLLPAYRDAATFAAEIRAAMTRLCKPFDFAGERIGIGASMGIAMLDRAGGERWDLFGRADAALYAAKAAGRGTIRIAPSPSGRDVDPAFAA